MQFESLMGQITDVNLVNNMHFTKISYIEEVKCTIGVSEDRSVLLIMNSAACSMVQCIACIPVSTTRRTSRSKSCSKGPRLQESRFIFRRRKRNEGRKRKPKIVAIKIILKKVIKALFRFSCFYDLYDI